jgi:hypothetical protein
MKHQWLAYIIVALLSIGAGVAIAGLPDNVPVDATIVGTTSTVPATSIPEVTETTDVVSTTEPATTEPTSSSTSTSSTTTTESPSTSEPSTLPDRADISVVTANGSGIAGAAAANAARLESVGYVDVVPRNGTTVVDLTVVYYVDGFEEAAQRLATDLDLLPEFIAPLDQAPEVLDLPADAQLVAYIGIDRG